MINQLRLYHVAPDRRDTFPKRFEDHAARIMRERYGFRVLAMWFSKEDDQLRFVYLLAWPDIATKEASWAAFMADEEWFEIKRISRSEGGEPVLSVEDILLDAVPFSAALDVAS